MHDAAFEASEHREHAEHAGHAHDPFIARVSITIAVLAVVAAVAGSLETIEDGAAITDSSRAVLAQDQATDSWGFYEAKSLKKHIDEISADAPGAKGVAAREAVKKDAADEPKAMAEAKEHEKARDEFLKESQAHEHRHHRLSVAATLLEMGIAVATIAIITRRKWPWLASVALGLGGLTAGAWAFIG